MSHCRQLLSYVPECHLVRLSGQVDTALRGTPVMPRSPLTSSYRIGKLMRQSPSLAQTFRNLDDIRNGRLRSSWILIANKSEYGVCQRNCQRCLYADVAP